MVSSSVIRAAGFVVYKGIFKWNEPEFLLLMASNASHHWTPPKGHLDPGEDNYQAALRELNEETGITEKLMDIHHNFCQTIKYNTPKGPKECAYYLTRVDDSVEIQLSKEHLEYKWVKLDQLSSLGIYPQIIQLLRDCYAEIQKVRSQPIGPL